MSQGQETPGASPRWVNWLKRGTTVLTVLALAGLVAYVQWGQPPFVAVASQSMAPTLERGDLIVVEPVDPATVEVGDVIVVSVPGPIQDRYNYPSSIVHRVVEIDASAAGNKAFRTKGDNTNEDPFTTYPADVRGQVSQTYRDAGYPLLFLTSQQGRTFLLATAAIYVVYRITPYVENGGNRLKASFARAVTDELTREVTGDLPKRIDRMEARQEQSLATVHDSMDRFSAAMEEYAVHLESHTAAVQAMAAAAEDLRDAVVEDPPGDDGDTDDAPDAASDDGDDERDKRRSD